MDAALDAETTALIGVVPDRPDMAFRPSFTPVRSITGVILGWTSMLSEITLLIPDRERPTVLTAASVIVPSAVTSSPLLFVTPRAAPSGTDLNISMNTLDG